MLERGGNSVYPRTNLNLLKLVLTGVGGYIQVDSTCTDCPVDSSGYVEFPSYTPPVNSGGMLCFSSINDYNFFIKATDLESLNALDSVLGFQSLRHLYNLNEFYNHDWADTASLSLDNDEYQTVMNERAEVKIGNKFYKALYNHLYAVINNNNVSALDSVRAYGVFAAHSDILYYNEENGSYVTPAKREGTGGTQSCNDFNPVASSDVNYNSKTVYLTTFLKYGLSLPNYPQNYTSVKANYTIDWGDGIVQTFVGFCISNNVFTHQYQWPVSGYLIRNINIQIQLVAQTNPTSGYNYLVQNCPFLPNINWVVNSSVYIDSGNHPDCLGDNIKRNFIGISQYVNGTNYRLECQLAQMPHATFGITRVKAKGIFTKWNGSRWKRTKSIGKVTLNLRGDTYAYYSCTQLYKTFSLSTTSNKKQKIKLPYDINGEFYTKRILPLALNADFIWKYNNNQISVGNYTEILKP